MNVKITKKEIASSGFRDGVEHCAFIVEVIFSHAKNEGFYPETSEVGLWIDNIKKSIENVLNYLDKDKK